MGLEVKHISIQIVAEKLLIGFVSFGKLLMFKIVDNKS